jgi:hypothetical protein
MGENSLILTRRQYNLDSIFEEVSHRLPASPCRFHGVVAAGVCYSLPWIFLWLLRLGLEPLVDTAEFRANAADEYRRIRKKCRRGGLH